MGERAVMAQVVGRQGGATITEHHHAIIPFEEHPAFGLQHDVKAQFLEEFRGETKIANCQHIMILEDLWHQLSPSVSFTIERIAAALCSNGPMATYNNYSLSIIL